MCMYVQLSDIVLCMYAQNRFYLAFIASQLSFMCFYFALCKCSKFIGNCSFLFILFTNTVPR